MSHYEMSLMENIASKLSQLKNRLASAAFLVSKEGAAKEAHSEIVQSLVILSEIESLCLTPEMPASATEAEHDEINKVRRRLKLWAKRPDQMNAQILNAFLKLERSGIPVITENSLKNALPEDFPFESNFAQMKSIAPKNHGKVFGQYGVQIRLWPPVVYMVREYERLVFEEQA